jgi:hypothetical protein
MATQIVTGNRAFAQPGIDGGEFTANNPATNVLIVARTFRVEAIVITQVSTGSAFGGTGVVPLVSRFNTAQSSGAFIPAASLTAGFMYDWISVGLGG